MGKELVAGLSSSPAPEPRFFPYFLIQQDLHKEVLFGLT